MTRIAVARLSQHLAGVPAAILAGGLGTRLRPRVAHVPKVLAPIQGRPFVTFILDQLAKASLRRILLLTGHRAAMVEAALGNRHGPLRLEYSREENPLGTGGAIRHALNRLDAQTILLMNGDSYCSVNLPALHAQHRRSRADLSMVVTRVADAGRFGEVRLRADGAVGGYTEKTGHSTPGLINAGIYMVQRSLLDELPAEAPCSLERDWLPRWIAARNVAAFPTEGPFLDIGTPESYATAEAFFTSQTARPVQRQIAG